MWDTVHDVTETSRQRYLSHDLPCLSCGHAAHVFLACDSGCECAPAAMPGTA